MSRMLATLLLFAASGGGVQGQPLPADAAKTPPPAATLVSLPKGGTLADAAAALAKQTGIPFDVRPALGTAPVRGDLSGVPFWQAVEALADDAKCFAGIQGGKVALTPRPDGVPAPPSSVSGPFRVVLKRVTAERRLESAGTEYRVDVEVQWEPRFPVFLIDAEKAAGTVGKTTFADATTSEGRWPTGTFTHEATIRLKDIPREAKQIDELAGGFRLIAAEKTLGVEFKELTGDKPTAQTADGVSVTLLPAKGFEKRVQFAVELEYPPGHPAKLDSYLSGWSKGNTFRLFAPNDPAGVTTDKVETNEQGRRVTASYSFPNPKGVGFAAATDLKGWRVVYRTPGPMSEQAFAFKLKGVPLP